MKIKIETDERSIWSKIAEKCSWQATNVMGPLFAHTLMMGEVSIKALPVDHISQVMQQLDDMEIGIEMVIDGDLQGYLLVGYSAQDIPLLLHGLPIFNRETQEKHIISRYFTVRETSNLLAASFFSSLRELCGYKCFPVWLPDILEENEKADYTFGPKLPSMIGDNGILLVDAEIIPIGSWMRGAINCRMLYFPNLSSWAKLRNAQLLQEMDYEVQEIPAGTYVC